MHFLSKLTPQEVLLQITTIESFFRAAYEMDQLIGEPPNDTSPHLLQQLQLRLHPRFGSSGLAEYLHLQLLHKLMLCYSSQLQCNNCFLSFLAGGPTLPETLLWQFKKATLRFKNNMQQYARFIEQHRHLKGFEDVSWMELAPFQAEDIIELIE